MLERYLLNRGRVVTALLVRKYRGIAVAHGDTDAIEHYRAKYLKKVAHISQAPEKIVLTHINDISQFDNEWEDLNDWYVEECVEDPTAAYLQELKEERARRFLQATSVHHLQKMGFDAKGSWKSDVNGEEKFFFEDGDSVRWNDAVTYISKLGRLNEFIYG
jgi:hypothetical protein